MKEMKIFTAPEPSGPVPVLKKPEPGPKSKGLFSKPLITRIKQFFTSQPPSQDNIPKSNQNPESKSEYSIEMKSQRTVSSSVSNMSWKKGSLHSKSSGGRNKSVSFFSKVDPKSAKNGQMFLTLEDLDQKVVRDFGTRSRISLSLLAFNMMFIMLGFFFEKINFQGENVLCKVCSLSSVYSVFFLNCVLTAVSLRNLKVFSSPKNFGSLWLVTSKTQIVGTYIIVFWVSLVQMQLPHHLCHNIQLYLDSLGLVTIFLHSLNVWVNMRLCCQLNETRDFSVALESEDSEKASDCEMAEGNQYIGGLGQMGNQILPQNLHRTNAVKENAESSFCLYQTNSRRQRRNMREKRKGRRRKRQNRKRGKTNTRKPSFNVPETPNSTTPLNANNSRRGRGVCLPSRGDVISADKNTQQNRQPNGTLAQNLKSQFRDLNTNSNSPQVLTSHSKLSQNSRDSAYEEGIRVSFEHKKESPGGFSTDTSFKLRSEDSLPDPPNLENTPDKEMSVAGDSLLEEDFTVSFDHKPSLKAQKARQMYMTPTKCLDSVFKSTPLA